MKKIVIIIILIVVGGILSALYTQIWNPSWNPFRPVSKIVLTKMALNMKKLEAFRVNGDFKVKSGNIEIGTGIILDINRIDSRLKGVIKTPMPSTEVRFIKINEDLYIEPGTFSSSLESYLTESVGSKIIEEVEGFNGKWIRIDMEAAKDMAEILSMWTGKEITINEELYQEKWQEFILEMSKLLIKKDFYDVKEELPDEEIDNQLFYHYLITLNQSGVEELTSEMTIMTLEYFPVECYWTRDEYFILDVEKSIREKVDEYFKAFRDIDLEVWIGQKDNYLHRIKFEKDELENGDAELILMDINFSQFNQSQKIEAPKDFIDSQEILKRFIEEIDKQTNK